MADGTQTPVIQCGWHEMDERTYHADPCPSPALSASCAKTLINKTAHHAWIKHPHSGLAPKFTPTAVMDMGKAVHAAVFGGAKLYVIEHPDYRSGAAKSKRDFANDRGLIPILEHQLEAVDAMAEIAKVRFHDLYGGEYHAERVAIWKCPRTGGYRKAALDTSAISGPIIVDFKTSKAGISDEECEKRIFSMDMQIQAAAYEEAMEVLHPEWAGKIQFVFQFQEQDAPYCMARPFEMSEAAMQLGREQWQVAGAIWDASVQSGNFHAYGTELRQAMPPPWAFTAWQDRMMTDETLKAAAGVFAQ